MYISLHMNEITRQLWEAHQSCVREERKIERLEELLSKRKGRVTAYRQTVMPSLLQQLGVDEVTINGVGFSIKESVFASISNDRRDAAMEWLSNNGHGDSIRREVSVAFPVGADKMAGELVTKLRDEGHDAQDTQTIHSSTLAAIVRARLKQGMDVDRNLLGVRVVRAAVTK